MKKEYIKPTVKTVRIRVHSMLASSPGTGDTEGEGNPGGGASKEAEIDDIGW